MGLAAEGHLDVDALRERVQLDRGPPARRDQGHARVAGRPTPARHGSAQGPARGRRRHAPRAIEEIGADFVLLATGSRPRVPDWAPLDGERVLTTREAYPPAEIPEHLCVIGSGVTGVEFTHMFSALGSKVTLVVSRQQVLPQKDPEVAAVLEAEFLGRGVQLLKGARAEAIGRTGDVGARRLQRRSPRRRVARRARDRLGAEQRGSRARATPGVEVDRRRLRHDQPQLPLERRPHLRGGRPLGEAPALVGRVDAGPQDRRAPDGPPRAGPPPRRLREGRAPAIFTEPEIADVGLAEAEAFASGRKIRVTKVPFSTNAKALIKGDPRGFVKILSDPATGVVLGGSIVGRSAAELISVIARRGDEQPQGRPTSPTRCSCTPPSPRASPTPRPDGRIRAPA